MQKTVLCIDDEEPGLLVRKLMLETEGYHVLAALGGTEALALLAKFTVDVVILDFQMPHMNGAEVAHRIRQSWPKLPIILFSGYPEAVPEAALTLVDGFLTKGDSPERLLSFLSQALGPESLSYTILNVNDNEAHRYVITHVLRRAGYKVIEAQSGREALALASSGPALIILDINLPDVIGFDVCRTLKENSVTRNIPVIHISATFPSEAAEQRSQASGANGFFEYPLDPSRIVEIVKAEVERAHQKSDDKPR